MKTERISSVLVAFWFCLNPLIEKDDGTLPLPLQSTQESRTIDAVILDLLCF